MDIFFWTVVGYLLVMFVGLRLIVPLMGFGKYKLPKEIPAEIKNAIRDLENKSSDGKSFLQNLYTFILDKNKKQWSHGRFKAGTHLHRLRVSDLNEIWNTNKFIYCQSINLLAAVMVANSKFFKEEDVRMRHNFLNLVVHQYMQVKVGGVFMDFDPAGAGIRGMPLGAHASIFG